ncbi:copper transporter [Paractinoplanes toevensis]|uniref:Copper transporter MctB n=1 Tax=Paractinoplanes toevensis TaxID=571911 RepID=A0A919T657_9ACTN|nr:copper transporter [Actinoplanes toevensis]GIM89097.1 copper transporter MctB [Actinoplanes toevensis]
MINFRFYALALASVFAALTIGLVLGTAVANGPVTDGLKDQTSVLSRNLSNQRDENQKLLAELKRDQNFATEVAPALLGGKLSGRKLLVVALPGSSEYADDVVAMLTMAGATITAQLAVHDRFFDPAAAYELLDLIHRTGRPTVPIDGLPANSDAVETAGAQLTLALLQHPDSLPAPADVTAVITAYAKADFLSVGDTAAGGAEGAVIISGEPFSDKHATEMNRSAVTLSTQFSLNKPLVIAGFGPGDGNLIAAVRRTPKLAGTISTIDNAGFPKGQVATGLATAERMVQGKVGQYGNDVGATSEVPKAAA